MRVLSAAGLGPERAVLRGMAIAWAAPLQYADLATLSASLLRAWRGEHGTWCPGYQRGQVGRARLLVAHRARDRLLGQRMPRTLARATAWVRLLTSSFD